ncbi:ferredoxin/flavodoxin [Clostridiales Family XIII bacterium PM5-7]
MIFYFTGTGNSKYVAKKIKSEFGGELIDISTAMKRKELVYSVEDGETIFFIFPIYFFGLPNIVGEFLKQVTFSNATPDVCAIVTCGGRAGGADGMFKKMVKDKQWNVKGFYPIVMVDNYIFMFKVPLKEEQVMIERRAEKELSDVITAIRFNYRTTYKSTLTSKLLTKVAYSFYNGKCSTKKFWVRESCIGCGLCQTICPVDAITMDEGKPEWIKEQCVHCVGCINRCPVSAIEYGKATEHKGRFVHRDL